MIMSCWSGAEVTFES